MAFPTHTVTCHAKVNLALSVGPPDANGMHPIASWMVALAFGDTLKLTPRSDPAQGLSLTRRFADDAPRPQPIDWPVEKDLAFRAHAALSAEVGEPLPAIAELTKVIPAGAGLGGGSSDAAAMLVALRTLFELDVTDEKLAQIAGTLGSDVVFLVHAMLGQTSALVTGLGDVIEPLPKTEPIPLVLILPDAACPTGPVYGRFDLFHPDAALREPEVRRLTQTLPIDPHQLFNDLAGPAMQVAPRVAQARAHACRVLDRPVHVTGSGAALFALGDEADAQQLGQAGLASVATQTLA